MADNNNSHGSLERGGEEASRRVSNANSSALDNTSQGSLNLEHLNQEESIAYTIPSVAGKSSAASRPNIRRPSMETITNYGNARPGAPGSVDRMSAPASFADFAAQNLEDHHQSISQDGMSVDTDDQLVLFKELMKQYSDLYTYVNGGRQEMIEEVNAAERSYQAVERSVLHFSPAERQDVNLVLSTFAERIHGMKARIQAFDDDIPLTRERLVSTLTHGLFSLPSEMMMQFVQECQWPNEHVCQDLNLPFDFTLMYCVLTLLQKRNIFTTEGGDAIKPAAEARIKELEEIVRKLSIVPRVEVTRDEKSQGKPSTMLKDVPQSKEKLIDYVERRKRTKFPHFEHGTAAEAQQWLKHYEHLCSFVQFDDQDKVAELSVVLSGQALNWLLNIERSNWSTVKKQFLLQFGGGEDPALVALSELKYSRNNDSFIETKR